MWLKAPPQVSSRVNHEGSLLCGRMYVVVVLELHQWKKLIPVILPLIDEEVEILLQLLVDPFHLSVTLWMVGHSCSQLYAKKAVELLCQFHYELWTSVGMTCFGSLCSFQTCVRNKQATPRAVRLCVLE